MSGQNQEMSIKQSRTSKYKITNYELVTVNFGYGMCQITLIFPPAAGLLPHNSMCRTNLRLSCFILGLFSQTFLNSYST